MTTWTNQTTTESVWSELTSNTTTAIYYNDPIKYNADYLTYNGYYISDQTDWDGVEIQQTAWSA